MHLHHTGRRRSSWRFCSSVHLKVRSGVPSIGNGHPLRCSYSKNNVYLVLKGHLPIENKIKQTNIHPHLSRYGKATIFKVLKKRSPRNRSYIYSLIILLMLRLGSRHTKLQFRMKHCSNTQLLLSLVPG